MLSDVAVLVVMNNKSGNSGHAGQSQFPVVSDVQFGHFDWKLLGRRRFLVEVTLTVDPSVWKRFSKRVINLKHKTTDNDLPLLYFCNTRGIQVSILTLDLLLTFAFTFHSENLIFGASVSVLRNQNCIYRKEVKKI